MSEKQTYRNGYITSHNTLSDKADIVIELPADLRERMEALDTKTPVIYVEWTPEKDAALLSYWQTKRHYDVARALDVSFNTALKRYRYLTGGAKHGY